MAACSDDEPVEKPAADKTSEQEQLPVREWYPRQKYSPQQSQFSQPQMTQPPVFSTSPPAQQQTWSGGYQVYQAPPVIIVQPQSQGYGSGTAGQAPAQQMATPPQYVYPYYYYQAPQRPWGEVPQTSQGTQQSYTRPPGGYQQMNPWEGRQAPGGTMYPGWGVPYDAYPGTAVPGYPW